MPAKSRTEEIEAALIAAGVRNLKEFGYPNCNKDNILTDEIYRQFFLSMLEENKGGLGPSADKVIDSLIERINQSTTTKEST